MGLVIAVATIAGYGAAWWILGLWATGHGGPLVYAPGIVAPALLVGLAWWRKRYESPERRRERAQRGKIIGLVTGVLGVLILLAVKVLGEVDRLDLLPPVVAIVMGLHFVAFAGLFPARIYLLTSELLVALGVAALFLRAGQARVLLVSIGAACILWLTCAAVLVWPWSRRTGV